MSLAPVVPAAKGDTVFAASLARDQSRVTHAAAECLDAAEAPALILTAGIVGRGTDSLNAAAAEFSAPKVHSIAAGSRRSKMRNQIRSTTTSSILSRRRPGP